MSRFLDSTGQPNRIWTIKNLKIYQVFLQDWYASTGIKYYMSRSRWKRDILVCYMLNI